VTKYPAVLSESQTLDLILAGRSIARYGDGEFKMANHGVGIKSQVHHPVLSRRLGEILQEPGECLVGIPNIHEVLSNPLALDDKRVFWAKHLRFSSLLNERVQYASSFISRPDSAPWTDTPEWWDRIQSLWVGQDITVVHGSGKSLKPEDLVGAGEITSIQCPKQHAFSEYESILERIGTPKRALICLGPTATVLAYDLCRRGVHAIDLGHLAIFMRKRRRGEPLIVQDEDKAVDRLDAAEAVAV